MSDWLTEEKYKVFGKRVICLHTAVVVDKYARSLPHYYDVLGFTKRDAESRLLEEIRGKGLIKTTDNFGEDRPCK